MSATIFRSTAAAPVARRDDGAGRAGHERRQRDHPRPDAERDPADPGARRPPDRRRRQAHAADADARRRGAARLSPARATTSSPPRSSSSTPPPCCTTTWSTASGLRRGKGTANIIWGNPASVLVGDFLFARAFELMVEDGSLKVLKILSHAQRGDRRGRGRPADRAAQDRDQRGALPATSSAPRPPRCSPPPPHLARSSPSAARPRSGARRLTAAISASPSSWSTTRSTMRGSRRDGQGRRRRLPRRQDDPAGDPRLRPRHERSAPSGRRRSPASASDDDLAHAIRLLDATDALADTVERARQYGRRAIDALAMFPSSKAKAALTEAAEFAVARAY